MIILYILSLSKASNWIQFKNTDVYFNKMKQRISKAYLQYQSLVQQFLTLVFNLLKINR